MGKQILVAVPVREEHKIILEENAADCLISYATADGASREAVEAADIIFGNVDPKLLAGCRHLELLQLNSAGAEPYIRDGVLPEGAELTCASGAYGLALAEHMLGMLLAMKKKLYVYYDNQKQALWRDEGAVTGIYNSRTLIVGLGDIGTEFAKRMKALGSYVVGIRRTAGRPAEWADELYTPDSLEEQLPLADIVALTLPGTKETDQLMNQKRLMLMKPSAFLLNAGRGNAVDTEALAEVLEKGHLAGAALDVTDPEPLPPDHPLWRMERVYITPHISGEFHMEETLNRIVAIGAENIRRCLIGEPLRNVIDRQKGYRRAQPEL